MTAVRRVVAVEVDLPDAELAADVLWQTDPSAVGEEDLGNGRVRLTADISESGSLADLPPSATVRVLELDGEDYLDRWRAWARPMRAGTRVVIQPAWLPVATTGPADLIVSIDPGRTFGSGAHPSTRLVLTAMEEHLTAGGRVLDVGTGSGVLAVTACLLGASVAVAIDIDPRAIDIAEANARANGVGDRIAVSTTPLDGVSESFDLVVANIGAAVLCDLAGELAQRVAPRGTLVLAGFLDDQARQVANAFATFEQLISLSEDGWSAAVLRQA